MPPVHQLLGCGIQRNLPRYPDGIADANGLRIGADGGGRFGGGNDLLVHGSVSDHELYDAMRRPVLSQRAKYALHVGHRRMVRITRARCLRSRT